MRLTARTDSPSVDFDEAGVALIALARRICRICIDDVPGGAVPEAQQKEPPT